MYRRFFSLLTIGCVFCLLLLGAASCDLSRFSRTNPTKNRITLNSIRLSSDRAIGDIGETVNFSVEFFPSDANQVTGVGAFKDENDNLIDFKIYVKYPDDRLYYDVNDMENFRHVIDDTRKPTFYAVAGVGGGSTISRSAIWSNSIDFTYSKTITTAEELRSLDNSTKSFALGSNLDLSGISNWTPIKNFGGRLSGNGYVISNLFSESMSENGIGLFDDLSGLVENLKMENVTIIGSVAGGIAGINRGTIRNCEVVSGNIGKTIGKQIGGIAGINQRIIQNSTNRAQVFGNTSIGGISGTTVVSNSSNGGTTTVSDSINYGEVTGSVNTGGIIGRLSMTTGSFTYLDSAPKIQGNFNSGNIFGGTNTGGIIGSHYYNIWETYSITISSLKNTGSVSGTGDFTGGILGYFEGGKTRTTLSSLENSGIITGVDYVGGVIGGQNHDTPVVNSISSVGNTANVTGRGYVGGIVGRGVFSLTGLTSDVKVTGKYYIGGIAGALIGNVVDCDNYGSIEGNGSVFVDGQPTIYLGGVIGYLSGSLKNCDNYGSVRVTSAGDRLAVGGIVGFTTGSIEGCTNNAPVSGDGPGTGGIAGIVVWNSPSSITSCENFSNVVGDTITGGIAGFVIVTRTSTTANAYFISSCRNTGNVTATGKYSGGIIGSASGLTDKILGFIPIASSKITIESCENSGNIRGTDVVAGILARHNSVLTLNANSNTGTLTTTDPSGITWNISPPSL